MKTFKFFIGLLILIFIVQTADSQIVDDTLIDFIGAMQQPHANFYKIQKKAEAFFLHKSGLSIEDSSEDGAYSEYKRWEWFWKNRVGIDGNDTGSFKCANKAALNNIQNPVCILPGADNSNWTNLGTEISSQYDGIVVCIKVDPTDNNIIYLGTNGSGVWKTTNGMSANPTWQNITDGLNLPGLGVLDIAISKLNHNIVFIATGITAHFSNYGIGLYKSINGGQSWSPTGLHYSATDQKVVYKVLIDNNDVNINTIYACVENEIWKSIDGGANWGTLPICTVYTAPIINHSQRVFRHIVMHPNNSNILYASTDDANGDDGGALFFITTDGGVSWTQVNLPGNITTADRISIAVTPALNEQDNVWVLYYDINDRIYLKKYNIISSTWTDIYDHAQTLAPGGYSVIFGGINYWCNDLVVSPTNANNIYAAGYRVSTSNNGNSGSATFTWRNSGHVDTRALAISSDGTNDIVFAGNDGGISRSVGGSAWTNINGTGLIITQFYGIGGKQEDPDLISGGSQDNDYLRYNSGTWSHYSVGDAYDCVFDPLNTNSLSQYAYGESNSKYNYLQISNDNALTWGQMSQPTEPSNLVRPIVINSLNNNLYVGYHNVWKSATPSISWTSNKISDFDAFPNMNPGWGLGALAVAPSNPNYIYAAFSEPKWNWPDPTTIKFFCTRDGGISWTDIGQGMSINSEYPLWAYGITDITVDPNDPNRIWITFNSFCETLSVSGLGKFRVIYGQFSNSANNWTWVDISTGLSCFPVNCISYQKGTDDLLYAGTDVGVFYWDKPNSTWKCFNNNLPVTIVTDLEINYCAGKIRAATYGRGLWESPLKNTVQVPQEISNNTIWPSTAVISQPSDLIIDQGKTLTIQGKVLMNPDRKIIIQPGAKLLIDGGKITCSCGMWQGIELRGNKNASQSTPGAQGIVELKNGAVIENALQAIRTIKINTDGSPDWNTTGGIVKADGATFRNNKNGVWFGPYENKNGNIVQPNISYFTKCTFESDNNYIAPSNPPNEFVGLYGVQGIRFLGCTFQNIATITPPAKTGIVTCTELVEVLMLSMQVLL